MVPLTITPLDPLLMLSLCTATDHTHLDFYLICAHSLARLSFKVSPKNDKTKT